MKYWFIFVFVLVATFGGFCVFAINSSQNYLGSIDSINCYSGHGISENCTNSYSLNKL